MSLTGISANRLELLQIADAVAREKVIDREIVLAAMADAIQKAYRRLAKELHPDRNPAKDAESKFKEVNEEIGRAHV